MKKLILCLGLVLLSTNLFAQKDKLQYQESSARSMEPAHSVMIAPFVADMKLLGDRVSYTESQAFADYAISPAIVELIPTFKNIALSRAAKHYGADAIVAATVDVVTNENGRLEITISGYPVKYVNFRNATLEDVELQARAQAFRDVEGAFDEQDRNVTIVK